MATWRVNQERRVGPGAAAAYSLRAASGGTIRSPRSELEPHGSIDRANGVTGVTELDIAMMQRALRLADQAAAMGEVPIGAVVYRGDRVIAEAFNLRETASDPTGHAELLALAKAGKALGEWRLTDCSLAVTLEPCPMCAGALVNARLGRLIYGAADPKAGACQTLYEIPTDNRLNHRVTMYGGVLADQCRKQLRAFFQHRRQANKIA